MIMNKFIPNTSSFGYSIPLSEIKKSYLENFRNEIEYSISGFKTNLEITLNLLRDNYRKEIIVVRKKVEGIKSKHKDIEEKLKEKYTDCDNAREVAFSELSNYEMDYIWSQERGLHEKYIVKDYEFSIDKQIKAYFLLIYGFLEHKFYELCLLIQQNENIDKTYSDSNHYLKGSLSYMNNTLQVNHNIDKLKKINKYRLLRNSVAHENSYIRGNKWESIIKLITEPKYENSFKVLHEEIIYVNDIPQNKPIDNKEINAFKGENIFVEFKSAKLVQNLLEYISDFLIDTINRADCKYQVSLKHNLEEFYISSDCKLLDKSIIEQNGKAVIKLKLRVFNTFLIKKEIHILKKNTECESIIILNKLSEKLKDQIQEKGGINNTQEFINNQLLLKCNDKRVEVLIEE